MNKFATSCNKDKVDKVGIVLCGDFNAEPKSETTKTIIEWGKVINSHEDLLFTLYQLLPTEKCKTLDYLYHSRELTVIETLSMPTKEEVGQAGLPSELYPSDHLSLYAKFQFL